MANPVFRLNQFAYSTAVPVTLNATVSIGASGAPTLVSGTGRGISSIARSSAGVYLITLSHAYSGLINASVIMNTAGASGAVPAAPIMFVKANAVSTAAAPTITIACADITGVAADPASGEKMQLSIVLQNSSAAY